MKATIHHIFLSIMILATSTGCNAIFNSESKTLEVQEGIDIHKNPLGAIQKVIELSENAQNIPEEIVNQEPVEPISFKELINYLPPAPLGWKAEKPEGSTNSFSTYSISQVNQAYTNGDKKIKVSIFDWAFNSALYTPFILTTEFSQESTDGYNKGIKIGDFPGREEYTYATKEGSLNLLVNSRFLVQINGNNIEDIELREWWQRMDDQSLSKISNK